MTETTAAPAASPGALLRAAREKQGLHVAALAAAIKVAPRKLEALEADRYDELPDITFTRALAQTVCRALKIDAEPVLALLPRSPGADRLEHVASGLNAPFRDRPGREESTDLGFVGRPVFWAPVIVLLAAAVLYLLPDNLFGPSADVTADGVPAAEPVAASGPMASAVEAAAPPASSVVDTVHSAPPADDAASVAAPVALLVLRASESSWVEVRDGGDNVLLSRTLQPGESVALDGALPLRATIGNVAATTVTFRGRTLDLAAQARDNVARLQLD